jgi:pyruvate/2-oxoacid:ferredoxin oxidoreductase alpha subunit/pyruvate/2-oxoacid:ferredoxin oxidoreductase beta subunit
MKILATGNRAAALAAKLARVDVVAAYPITPQTEIVEKLAEFIARKELNAEYICTSSEFEMMGNVVAASLLGKRCFTATCSQGLLFAYEMIHQAAWSRVPIIMAFPTRSLNTWNLWPDHLDFFCNRDTGWIQLFARSAQEVLDLIIQAYRICEHKSVLLPAMIGFDGFEVSFTTEGIELPTQASVDEFLPPYRYPHIEEFEPISITSNLAAPIYTKLRFEQSRAMESAHKLAKEVDREFRRRFGRSYPPLSYQGPSNPDFLLLSIGSMSGTLLHAAKQFEDIGVVDLKWFRPFPAKELRKLAEGVKSIGVLDRNFSGFSGVLAQEVRSTLYGLENPPSIIEFVLGLGGGNVSQGTMDGVIRRVRRCKPGRVWIGASKLRPKRIRARGKRVVSKGTSNCTGCGMVLCVRHILDVLRNESPITCVPAGCLTIVSSGAISKDLDKLQNFVLNAALVHTPFGAAACYGVGIARASQRLSLVLAGDGATVDIGFANLSGAAERNEDMLYVCYDNEAYMNTGVQRSSATPFSAVTTTTPLGKPEQKKDVALLMLFHGVPYVATATIGNLPDLRRKVERAKGLRGFRYLHVLTPCPTGWRFDPSQTIRLARLAESSGMFPCWEYAGKLKLQSKRPRISSLRQYLTLQGRFKQIQGDAKLIKELFRTLLEKWRFLRHLERFYG